MGHIRTNYLLFPLSNHKELCQTLLNHPLNVWSNTQLSTADLTSSEARAFPQPGLS